MYAPGDSLVCRLALTLIALRKRRGCAFVKGTAPGVAALGRATKSRIRGCSPDKALCAAIRERLLSGQTATGPAPSPRWGEGKGLNHLELTDLPVAQMLHAALHFFLLAGVERAGVRASEITAYPAGYRHARGIVVAAFRAGEAFAGTLELTGKTALVALIDRRIGPVIGHVLIAIIPHVFQRPQVVLNIRVLAVANKAPHRGGSCWCNTLCR